MTHRGIDNASRAHEERKRVCVLLEKRMNSMKKISGLSLMGAMSLALAGCGGGGGDAAVAQPTNPYYQNQVYNGGYSCASNNIQLRNSFGYQQCYNTTDLATGCAQVRGSMIQGLCRTERRIPQKFKWSTTDIEQLFRKHSRRYRDSYYGDDDSAERSVQIPLQAPLYPGESLKISGRIDSNFGWSAQLLQMGIGGMPVASGYVSSGDVTYANGDNLELVAQNANVQGQYGAGTCPAGSYFVNNQCVPNGQQVGGQCYASNTSACQVNYYYVNGQCCPNTANGTYGYGYGQMPQLPSNQMSYLQVSYTGGFDIELRGTAISCSDGHGNSYPCN